MSINQVFLSGNLTKDPELRTTQNGKAVCSFTVATNEGKDKTEFHNCVAWEKTAEVIAQYCKKGNRVAVSGKLQTRKWEKDGQNHYSTDIVVFQIDLPPKGADGGYTGMLADAAAPKQDEFEDEVPF